MIGNPFTVLASVDSTNNYAMAQVHAGLARHGAAWFAREQHSGRGQRSKQWVTQPGENIILSTVVEPFLLIQQQFALSAAIAIACHRFFSKYAGDETKIKWPNDLYWRDRKAGGILVENVLKGQDWKFAIAGIGININQTSFPEHLTNPVSLKQITGKTFDPVSLAKELCLEIENVISELKNDGVEKIIQLYNTVLYKRNEKVKLKKLIAVFETIIREVKTDGLLITEDTMQREFNFGDVEWV
jgi:BirA family biotin operon repressor/biotin-[acetyl-CoA-carboxylase] ligase